MQVHHQSDHFRGFNGFFAILLLSSILNASSVDCQFPLFTIIRSSSLQDAAEQKLDGLEYRPHTVAGSLITPSMWVQEIWIPMPKPASCPDRLSHLSYFSGYFSVISQLFLLSYFWSGMFRVDSVKHKVRGISIPLLHKFISLQLVCIQVAWTKCAPHALICKQ